MARISFKVSRADSKLIDLIVTRAIGIAKEFNLPHTYTSIQMDVIAAHANGCKIDLEKLLTADDGTFGHDVFGICKYMNRRTGELMENFVPRCAARD